MIKPILTSDEKVEYAKMILEKETPKGERFLGPHVKTSEGYISMQLYPSSNENLYFINDLRPENKDCLTVGSSCDQALTLLSMGARRVDILDVNPFTKTFFELKRQAILNLNQALAKAFLVYYPGQKHFLHPNTYKDRIRKHLKPSDQKIWDMVLTSPNKMNFFRLDDFHLSIPPYLDSREHFLRLRDKLKTSTVGFYNTALANASTIYSQYDIVLLSNVGDWYKTKERYVRDIKNLGAIVHDESLIQVGYEWHRSGPQETKKTLVDSFGNAITYITPKYKLVGGCAIILDLAEYSKIKHTLKPVAQPGEDE